MKKKMKFTEKIQNLFKLDKSIAIKDAILENIKTTFNRSSK